MIFITYYSNRIKTATIKLCNQIQLNAVKENVAIN